MDKQIPQKMFPFITPEFDNRYASWGDPNSIPPYRSPQLFEKRVNIALMYTALHGLY
jgi:hypothetical protein